MMRLPARLTVNLAKARIAQVFNSTPSLSLIHWVDPGEVLHPGSMAPVSREKMQGLVGNPAPVIWIGGSEPLAHPGIGHFVRAIAHSGHFVFLETNGAFLRRRIHEFQPLPRLFLTVRLKELQSPGSVLAAEGLRFARLSGFFTVVHSLLCGDSDLSSLVALRSFISQNDVDGWLITASSADPAFACKAGEARSQIPSFFWRRFSQHVKQALKAQASTRELPGASPAQGSRAEPCAEDVIVA